MGDLNNLETSKALLWVVPGTLIVLFRSFMMKGTFPAVSKDDISAFIIGSIIYNFIVIVISDHLTHTTQELKFGNDLWTMVLIVLPALIGSALGYLEANDFIGHALRNWGIRLRSPDATAWETMFRELQINAVIQVTLKDGTNVYGRWIGGRGGSASSTDAETMDIYIGETGDIDGDGNYVPHTPKRGAYIAAGEIRFFEVICS